MEPLLVLLALTAIPYLIVGLIVLRFGAEESSRKNHKYKPSVTIFIPTRNEKSQIGEKIENLLAQTYPIEEILVFDSSSDDTPRVVEEYESQHRIVKLIRRSKDDTIAQKLNDALELAKGEILVKTDCDSRATSGDAVEELIANFADPKVGGVCGVCTSKRNTEKNFRRVMTLIQRAESRLDSTIIAHSSSLVAFRRVATAPVGPYVIADDTQEFILIRKSGYRTIIDTKVVSEERVPRAIGAKRLWRDRRAHAIVKALMDSRDVLFNPKYGSYGLVVFPMNVFLLAISPFVLLLDAALVCYVALTTCPLHLLILIGIGILAVSVKPGLALSVIDGQVGGLNGTIRALLGRTPKWEKIE